MQLTSEPTVTTAVDSLDVQGVLALSTPPTLSSLVSLPPVLPLTAASPRIASRCGNVLIKLPTSLCACHYCPPEVNFGQQFNYIAGNTHTLTHEHTYTHADNKFVCFAFST